MGHSFLNFFLKESVVLIFYGIYAIALLTTSTLYYNQLQFEAKVSDVQSKIFGPTFIDQAATFGAEEAEKFLNLTQKIFRLYFPEDEDAWRVCSILGIGFGISNMIISMFNMLVMCLVYTELKSRRRKKMENNKETGGEHPPQKPPNSGTQKCTKMLFFISLTVTLIFTTFSALTLLSTGGLGGKTRVYGPHLTFQVFQSARAFFGTVALPAFIFIVFSVAWLVYTCCSGVSCAWTSSVGSQVLGKSGIFSYIQSGKNDKPNLDNKGVEKREDNLAMNNLQPDTSISVHFDDNENSKNVPIK